MTDSNLNVAEAYYTAVENDDFEKMEGFLHKDVKYVDPTWPLSGKDNVFPIAKSFASAVKQLTTAAKFSTNDRVMLVHDVVFHDSNTPMRTSVLMAFDGGLIKEIELIADTSKHLDVCKKIFTYSPTP